MKQKTILKAENDEYFHICSIMRINKFTSGFGRDISIETRDGEWYLIVEECEIVKKHIRRTMVEHFKIDYCPFCGLRLKDVIDV